MNILKKLIGISYDPKKIWQQAVFWVAVIILCYSCLGVATKERKTVEPGGNDIYTRQFDAWLKGRLDLDIPVDRILAELENPYDPYERRDAGAHFLWDHAFYEGKYYCYFGIAPLITVYAPFYAVTGKLPNIPMACLILAIAAMITTALAYREVVLRFAGKPNLWLSLIGLFGVAAASSVHLGLLCSDMYYLAVISAQAFSMAFVWLSLRAMRTEWLWVRMSLLVLAALALTLTVWSRPTVALICVFVFPFFIEFICGIRRDTLKEGLLTVGSFAVPLALGAAAVMIYNAARFSSPFDFGSAYQLTVSDVSLNTLDPDLAFSAFFSYFLCPAWRIDTAPYIELRRLLVLPVTERYIYADRACGVFAYGLPLGLFANSRLIFAQRLRGERDHAKIAAAVLCVLLCLGVAFSDFCLGGVNMRYVFDISTVLSLVGAAVLIALGAKSDKYQKAFAAAALIALCVLSVWMGRGVLMTFTAK